MSREGTQAATEAAARVLSSMQLYRTRGEGSSLIDGIVASMVISLECPQTTGTLRMTVLDCIDRLIRMKIDRGHLGGGHR